MSLPQNIQNRINILIDDDLLIRRVWERVAGLKGIQLRTFSSIEDFLLASHQYDPSTSIIYVDSQLGEGYRGEIESKKIFDCGFQNIILTTGYSELNVDQFHWLKGVVGKDPPW